MYLSFCGSGDSQLLQYTQSAFEESNSLPRTLSGEIDSGLYVSPTARMSHPPWGSKYTGSRYLQKHPQTGLSGHSFGPFTRVEHY